MISFKELLTAKELFVECSSKDEKEALLYPTRDGCMPSIRDPFRKKTLESREGFPPKRFTHYSDLLVNSMKHVYYHPLE